MRSSWLYFYLSGDFGGCCGCSNGFCYLGDELGCFISSVDELDEFVVLLWLFSLNNLCCCQFLIIASSPAWTSDMCPMTLILPLV
jgi:hypothetical protein